MNEDTLSQVDLFTDLTKRELQALAKSCQERKYSAGTLLFSQGDTGVGLYVVTHGTVRITRLNESDKTEEELGTAGPGEVLGEMALLDDLPRSATATASDDVVALLLPVWDFRSTLHSHPEIAVKLLGVLSRRLRKAENRNQDR